MSLQGELSGGTFGIQTIPNHNGAAAELSDDEYIELYRDFNNRLTSTVWSTDNGADRLVDDAELLGGEPNDRGGAFVRLEDPRSLNKMTVPEVKSFLRQNIGRVAFCRVDFGTHSVLWTSRTDADGGDEVYDRAAAIYTPDDQAKIIQFIERNGTFKVRESAARLVPELAHAVNNLSK